MPAAYDSYLEGRSLLGQRTSRDLRQAVELFSLAIAEDPGCAPALAGRARAHALLFDYSAARKALELEPASALYELNLGCRMFWARQYDRAAEQLSKTLTLAPELASAHYFLGRTYVEQGEYAKAEAEFERAEKLSPGDWNLTAARGYLYARSGRRGSALGIVGQLERLVARGYPFRSQMAAIHTALGDREQALDWLDRAVDAREGPLLWLEVDPRFDPVRSDLRFPELLPRSPPKS